jgi:hypothetical protein
VNPVCSLKRAARKFSRGTAFLMGKSRYMGCASQLRAAHLEILQDATVHEDWKGSTSSSATPTATRCKSCSILTRLLQPALLRKNHRSVLAGFLR